MQRIRIVRINSERQRKIVKKRKWHKVFLLNVKSLIKEACPILQLDNKNLYISVEINKYQSITNIFFGYKSFENEIFKVSDILHEKEKIIQIGSQYGVVTF